MQAQQQRQQADPQAVIDLETKFWQSMVEEDTAAALALLDEPAVMVSPMGTLKFDHAAYRRMAEQGSMVIKSFELRDMQAVFPTEQTAILTYKVRQTLSPRGQGERIEQEMADSSVWTRKGGRWLCAMHTETPVTPHDGQPRQG